MELSQYAIQEIVPHIIGIYKGKELVNLFNKCGSRDVYDKDGLPDIGKKNEQRPSKTEYTTSKLTELSGTHQLRQLLNLFINSHPEVHSALDAILKAEGFTIEKNGDQYNIHGGVINNAEPVINEAHFQEIEARILTALNEAKVSIKVVMAWFTNERLFQKLIEKNKEGLDVSLVIYDDGINRKHGVEISQLPHVLIKRAQRGGIMHNKFCVIDNQVVITGSYNWSDNAEFKNDENITVEYDPKQASEYSIEYRRLTS